MQQAIDYEIRWQIEQIEDGRAIQQATVLFDPDTGETRAMRTKEDAADYRYFPDPDLPPLVIAPRVGGARARATCRSCRARWRRASCSDYGLPEYDATTLTQSKAMAAYFEAAAKASGQPKLASNWIMGEVSRRLNAQEIGIEQAPVPAAHAGRADRAHRRRHRSPTTPRARCSRRCGRGEGADVDAVIEAKGLKQMNDTGALEKIIDEVIAANADNVAQFRPARTRPSTRWSARP